MTSTATPNRNTRRELWLLCKSLWYKNIKPFLSMLLSHTYKGLLWLCTKTWEIMSHKYAINTYIACIELATPFAIYYGASGFIANVELSWIQDFFIKLVILLSAIGVFFGINILFNTEELTGILIIYIFSGAITFGINHTSIDFTEHVAVVERKVLKPQNEHSEYIWIHDDKIEKKFEQPQGVAKLNVYFPVISKVISNNKDTVINKPLEIKFKYSFSDELLLKMEEGNLKGQMERVLTKAYEGYAKTFEQTNTIANFNLEKAIAETRNYFSNEHVETFCATFKKQGNEFCPELKFISEK